jgi:type IV pilus assembly protein PilM
MNLLPTNLGTRPRVAVEIRAEGVVAARAEGPDGPLLAVARVILSADALSPGLKVGNVSGRAEVLSAVGKALEAVADKAHGREVTLIVPDAAVRVLFLDFEALPAGAKEAMPLVRFRLKKLIPFESDDASVSYQLMSAAKGTVRVLAVAMPREVLAEYESLVRDAGFEPGAVLPSTLAALAGEPVSDTASLVVNAGPKGITTAIVQGGILLLHRTVDMTTEEPFVEPVVSLPLVDHESTAAEWALQEPLPIGATAVAEAARRATMSEPSAVLAGVREELEELARTSGFREVAQAVSVAAAYFEDTLGMPPGTIQSVGSTNAQQLRSMLREAEVGGPDLRVEELVEETALAQTVTVRVPVSWLAGVHGALRS